jgi:hypothetical protein
MIDLPLPDPDPTEVYRWSLKVGEQLVVGVAKRLGTPPTDYTRAHVIATLEELLPPDEVLLPPAPGEPPGWDHVLDALRQSAFGPPR